LDFNYDNVYFVLDKLLCDKHSVHVSQITTVIALYMDVNINCLNCGDALFVYYLQ